MALMEFVLLQFIESNGLMWPTAVLLFDVDADKLHIRARDDFDSFANPEAARVLKLLMVQLAADAKAGAGRAILSQLEDTLSNSLRITARYSQDVDDPDTALDHLFERHIASGA